MDGIKKNVISFLHLHNLSESVHFGAGNNVFEKNAEWWCHNWTQGVAAKASAVGFCLGCGLFGSYNSL